MTDAIHLPSICDSSANAFLQALAAPTPTPGGGSTAAMAGAMAASLVAMVAQLTRNRAIGAEQSEGMEAVRERSLSLQAALCELADADARAYESVLQAYRLPKDTPEQRVARAATVQSALIRAAETPLATARACAEVLEMAAFAALHGLRSARSDAAVAALLSHAALRSAALNVAVNLELITDTAFNSQADQELDALLLPGQRALAQALDAISPGD